MSALHGHVIMCLFVDVWLLVLLGLASGQQSQGSIFEIMQDLRRQAQASLLLVASDKAASWKVR